MANKRQVPLLKGNVPAWNAWRRAHPDALVSLESINLEAATLDHADLHGVDLRSADLRSADLRGADLSNANLSGAILRRATLGGANLAGTNLSNADLSSADFVSDKFGTLGNCATLKSARFRDAVLTNVNMPGADLTGADLRNVDLRGADLNGADLSESDLGGADLRGASLRGAILRSSDLAADFTGARLQGADLRDSNLIDALLVGTELDGTNFEAVELGSTCFANTNLASIKHLESAVHLGPSYIDFQTLVNSGSLPDVFLRGCGLSEILIEYLPSLRNQSIEFYSCFISYSHRDRLFARRLHDQLQGRGIRCWLDEHQTRPGDDLYEEIQRGIKHWDKVLLCCSKASLTSWWVDNEIDTAFQKCQPASNIDQHSAPKIDQG